LIKAVASAFPNNKSHP